MYYEKYYSLIFKFKFLFIIFIRKFIFIFLVLSQILIIELKFWFKANLDSMSRMFMICARKCQTLQNRDDLTKCLS